MRFVSFSPTGRDDLHFGVLLPGGSQILDLSHEACGIAPPAGYLGWFDEAGPTWLALRKAYLEACENAERLEALRSARATLALDDVRLLAPVPRPGKVLCIGLNYRDHAEESGMDIPERPLIFSKFPTSVVGPGEPVLLPEDSDQVDYEAELAIVIGRRARRITPAEAMNRVLGYTNFNDVSARDFQFADGQWQRGKSCDTFAPMGPWIVTRDEVEDPHRLRISFRLNGETLQDSTTGQLIFGVPELVSFISRTITLEPGDVIATGTPPGVGFARKPPIYVKDGDRMEVEVEGLGILENPARGI